MAEMSPFERVFMPSNPGQEQSVFGTIGAAFGNRSMQSRAEDAQAQGLATLSQMVQEGSTPQQAVAKWLNTPEGVQVFSQGGAVDLVNKFKASLDNTPVVGSVGPGQTPYTQRPGQMPQMGPQTPTTEQGTARTIAPTQTLGPGQQLQQQPQGGYGYQPAGRNPTSDIQSFRDMSLIANLPASEVERIAAIQALPPDQRDTEGVRYLQGAVKRGSIDQPTADMLHTGVFGPSGFIRIVSKLNDHGEEIGKTVVNMATGTSKDYITRGGITPTPVPTAVPGSPAAATQPGGDQPIRSDKMNMFFGTGLNAKLLSNYGQIVRGSIGLNIPVPGSEEASANIRNMNNLQTSLTEVAKAGAGIGVPSAVISAVQSMGPSASIWTDPKVSLNHAIDLHANMTDQIAMDKVRIRDPNQGKSEKNDAEKRIAMYETVLSSLPPLSQMARLSKDMAAGGPISQQNYVTPGKLVKGVTAGAGEAAGVVKRTAGEAAGSASTVAGEVAGTPDAPAASGRFSKLSNQELIKIDPSTLPPTLQPVFQAELARRRSLLRNKGAAQ